MAARGMRLYARKDSVLVDPVFYAKKREEQVSSFTLMDHVRVGDTYPNIVAKHPDADKEDVRIRGIKALDVRDGHETLSMINKSGIDESVRVAKENPRLKSRMLSVLSDAQRSSFIPVVKVELLRRRLHDT
jgi:hypothetical protein